MFSSNRAKENGGPTPKRMKTRQNKDSVREVGEAGGTRELSWSCGLGLRLPAKLAGTSLAQWSARGSGALGQGRSGGRCKAGLTQ